jgi:hypothetical protein
VERSMEWMLSFIPTMIGTLILAVSLFSAAEPMLRGLLQIMGASSMVTNFMKNALDFMKWITGPGA